MNAGALNQLESRSEHTPGDDLNLNPSLTYV